MPVVTLQVLQPANGAIFEGSGAARLQGAVTSSGHPPLFPKWYSSLVAPPSDTSHEAAIPVPGGGNALDFTPAGGLPLGSQTITLSTKDRSGESEAELHAVQHAGMAGGPVAAGNPAPCVVHVLVADLRAPASGATVSKAAGLLAAGAPSQWGVKAPAPSPGSPPPDPPFVANPAYHEINRLRYRWRFAPAGLPAGRAAADLVPSITDLRFVPAGSEGAATPPVPLVRFSGALPSSLGTGSYTLTLRVEHMDNPARGHEVSIPIVMAP
jgi:hypothetical protein